MHLRRDILPALVLLVVAGVYAWAAGGLPAGRAGDPGPALFPYILAGVLAALSLLLILRGLIVGLREGWGMPEDAAGGAAARFGLLRVGLAAILTVAFVTSFTTLGYIVASFLYGALMALLFRRDSMLVPLAAGLLAALSLYLLFAFMLGVRLPLGVLG